MLSSYRCWYKLILCLSPNLIGHDKSMVTIKSRILKYLSVVLSGFLVAMGFPGFHFPTIGLGIILPFALIPLFLAVENLPKMHAVSSHLKEHYVSYTPLQRAIRAFFCFWIFGFVVQLCAFFWISKPIIFFSSFKPTLAYPMYVGICALTALYFPFIFTPIILKIWYTTRHPNKKLPLVALAMILVLFEIMAPRFFNWTFGSLMHSELYINQLASVFGFNVISFFIFYTNLSLANALSQFIKYKSQFFVTILFNAICWALVFSYGYYRIYEGDHLLDKIKTTRIAYVQPNFTFNSIASLPLPAPDAQKQNLQRLLEMSEEAVLKAVKADGKKPDLIIWPESATQSFYLLDQHELNLTKQFTAKQQIPILIQATKWDLEKIKEMGIEKAPVWSASFLIRPDGSKSKDFEKWVPMPFGESFPLESFFPSFGEQYRKIFENASKLEIGTSFEGLAYSEHEFVAPLICFDSINQQLPRLQASQGKASLFVNQANFVWMVDSNAGLEFSILNKFRSIENSRSLVMVSNTGPSMAYDQFGRVILKPTKLLTQATGYVDVPLSNEVTLFSLLGNWPLIIAGLLSTIWFLFAMKNTTHEYRR